MPKLRRSIVQEGRSGPWPHSFPFDPTYGRTRDDLLALPPPEDEPADFDAFWRATYAENEALPLRYSLHAVPYPDPAVTAYRVTFDCWGQAHSGAWLLEPSHGGASLGCVIGHGYGGREDIEPGDWCLNSAADRDVARIFPVARGFHISPHEGIPYNDGGSHVLHGIGHRDTYVLRGCVAEQWTCSRILLERHPQLARRLVYTGGSFGGGLGALMLPWCDRFAGAQLGVPTFGHHPIRLRSPCQGSGERVRQHAVSHPEVGKVLAYYDAATAARRIRIPVAVAAALFDPGVPPPGQFAVANALAGEVHLSILSHGHFQHPETAGEGPRHELAAGRFLRRVAESA
jgi:cephalosporin-C deacetylase